MTNNKHDAEACRYDVLAFGETMLRLTPHGYDRFEQSSSIQIHIGGSESNTAVGLARLGHRTVWFSRLTRNPLGRLIANSLAYHGVDVSRVCWTDQDRIGTYYLERGTTPRETEVLYDRAYSAASKIRPDDLPMDLLAQGAGRIFHTSGITLGISKSSAETALAAAQAAKESGIEISFDVNFRGKLWSPSEARQGCEELCALADYIFLPMRDARTLYDTGSQPRDALMHLHRLWPQALIVLTLGPEGAMAIDRAGTYYTQAAYPAREVERLGGGDAFSAGFLSGVLQQTGTAEALRWGAAAAAVKYTIPGDLPVFDRRLIEQLVHAGDAPQAGIQR